MRNKYSYSYSLREKIIKTSTIILVFSRFLLILLWLEVVVTQNKKRGSSNEKKKKNKVTKKQKNLFLVLWVYTDCDLVLSSSRDFPRLKLLQFEFRWDLFLFCLSSLNIPTTL